MHPLSFFRRTNRAALRALSLAAVALMATASPVASGQTAWPTKPVKIIVAGGAGSSVDVFARVLGDRLAQSLGQPFVVEPRPGANGAIAGQAVATAKPDGYTFLFAGNSALVINPLMAKNLPYNGEKDLVAVASVVYVPLAIAVREDHPARTIQELLVQSRGKESFFATPGAASLSRLIGENINEKAGTKFINIAYPTGGAAQMDLIGGRVPLLIDGLGGLAPHVKSGKMRLLAVSTATRAKEFPDVPTIAEAIPGFVVPGVNSVVAPAGTPTEIMDLLNKKINEITQDRSIIERFATMGGDAAGGTRADLDRLLKDQRVTFKRLIEQAKIKEE